MANDRSVFMPPSVEATEGPFSSILTESLVPSQRPVNPAGRVTPAAAVMSIGTSFLKGASEGRIRAFQMEENEKLKKYAQLSEYVQRKLADPNLTDEARSHLEQEASKVFGGHLAGATAPQKGKKGGEAQGGIGGHVKNILHDLAIGMTGGKMPAGAKELGDIHTWMGKMDGELYGPENQNKFSVRASSGQYMSQANEILSKYPTGTPPETVAGNADLRKVMTDWAKVDPESARSFEAQARSAYPSQPSAAAELRDLSKIGQPTLAAPTGNTPPPPVPQDGPPPPSGATLRGGAGQPPAAPVAPPRAEGDPAKPATPFHPTGIRLSPEDESLLKKHGRVDERGSDWVVSATGQRMGGSIYKLGDRTAFFDSSGRELSVDPNTLVPYEKRRQVNIVNPDDQTDSRSVLVDNATGIKLDQHGIPLPESQQGWQEGAGFYKPPNPNSSRHFVNADGQYVYQGADGEWVKAPGTVRQTPDHWAQRFQIQDVRDERAALRQAESQYGVEKGRIKRAWETRKANIDKDLPLLKAPEKKAKLAEYKDSEAKELQDLEEDRRAMRQALGSMYDEHPITPEKKDPPNPGTPKSDPKTDPAAKASKAFGW